LVLGGAGRFLLQASHLGTLAAVDLVACAELTMMRQQERSFRTIIVVMVNTPVRSGMVWKGATFAICSSFAAALSYPKGHSRGERTPGSFCQWRCGKNVAWLS
jgi:hypothetical protein